MTQPRICFQTQTPLIRLLREVPPGTRVEDLREERDYLVSPGGVTRMLRGLAARLEERGHTAPTTWVSLARAVIVSTHAYARELRSWGVRVPIHASYPYLDESRRRVVTQGDIDAFDAKHGSAADDIAFVLVARLDAIKSHDVAIRALARIAHTAPRARLLLVGGGGFSRGKQGLGLSQASDWLASLKALARELGVEDRVVFTGGISDVELDVAFTRARAVLLPSIMEGFGLAAIEGWLYGKPALVSRGAGVAELVKDGENGFTFEPGDDAELAKAMFLLADDEELARRMGDEGRISAKTCHLDRGADDVWEIMRAELSAGQDWQHPGRRKW